MENKKRNGGEKPFESFMQELASESIAKAPPPTPSLSLKQKSGSVPDIRINDVIQKEKYSPKLTPYKTINHCVACQRKTILKTIVDLNGKKSSSDHSLTSRNAKVLHWLVVGQAPTSHLLYTVRQKLLNL